MTDREAPMWMMGVRGSLIFVALVAMYGRAGAVGVIVGLKTVPRPDFAYRWLQVPIETRSHLSAAGAARVPIPMLAFTTAR